MFCRETVLFEIEKKDILFIVVVYFFCVYFYLLFDGLYFWVDFIIKYVRFWPHWRLRTFKQTLGPVKVFFFFFVILELLGKPRIPFCI